ncbi:MAG: dockerin type I repeat-containing protein [Bacteroidaceae bacterium]|nr:dockerin type I repeat-containing protein [Bacteroidaceae bacterium]
MKKILLSLCLFVAATATQSFAANNNSAAQEPATTSINDNDLKGNKRFTVQVSTGEGGQIEIMGTGAISKNSVASATINTGEDVQLVITADEGYVLKTLFVDGTDVLANVSDDGIYTITAISKNMSVSATFEEDLVIIEGDVNLDGVVNSSDIVAIYNAIAGEGPTEGADVNGDGTINSADAVATYNIISGVE